MGLSEDLTRLLSEVETPRPHWDGPCSNSKQGGITFSMLSRYLVCKERFRIYAVEGIRAKPGFNHRIEFGNMWHLCEEVHAKFGKINPESKAWTRLLWEYAEKLCRKYPLHQEEINKWYNVCLIQFPIYLDYWSQREAEFNHKSIGITERVFCVPYSLPSGRVVYLRGKIDDILVSTDPVNYGVYVKDHKTKSDIDPVAVRNQLSLDLQTMMYVHAVNEDKTLSDLLQDMPILGVVYNVVKRPLSGGEGTIKPHEPTAKNPSGETPEQFYNRLKGVIDGTGLNSKKKPYPGPSAFFMRWQMDVSGDDLEKFLRVCLNPILENLCDDYEWWDDCMRNGPKDGYDQFSMDVREEAFEYHTQRHFVMPYGVWNPLAEGYECDVDNYMRTGDMSGMVRNAPLFEELNV